MYHQHDLVKPHTDAVAEELKRTRRHRAPGRSSPQGPGSIRSAIARALVLTGVWIHGSTPAVIGDRVVLLDPHRDQDLPQAA
jgi:hypothetical protein